MKSPFKFLDAYELKDRAVFFGREEEIEALYGMVFKTPLLLLYGLSGTGKTSLIRCGLASRFSAPNWYPFFIRRGEDLNESIRLALGNALPAGKTLPDTLPEQVSLLFRNYLRPVYLIFDQFEELFILGKKEEQLAFARSIRALLDAELPCKILMVMREEFIGQLYYLEKEIPGIYDFRLRVEPMGLKKVQEVISGSLQHFQVRVPDAERNIERMYNNISVGKSGVQLPHLQVYLDMFWREDFARTYPAVEQAHLLAGMAADPPVYPPLEFTPEEIDNFGNIESVLARFLAEQERSLQAELRQQFGNGIPEQAVRQVLDLFVSEQGTKKPRIYRRDEQGLHLSDTEELLLLLVQLSPAALSYALNQLYESRLLRERDDALELAHDSLAALIFRERSDEQRKISDLLIRLQNAQREFELSEGQELPSRKLLLDTEELLAVLPLSPELREFYEQSQAEWQRRAATEQEEAERRARNEEIAKGAEEEARLRRVAEKARRRANLGAKLASGLAIAAVVLGFLAFQQSQQATLDSDNAKISEREALTQKKKAEQLADEAKDLATSVALARDSAVDLRRIAEEALQKLSQETAAKEQLQFSNKADIVQSFVNAGYCDLAKKALDDLMPLVKKYPERAEFQEAAKELEEQVKQCKPLNTQK
ncbi:MAG TPA: hypothetical protein PLC89_13845 [Haliscomenobacter sp.]|uniref:ATP-binding protein n=1 Tax=Haliscomenobacter sp. TaxID=2717303 RepID=UPI002CD8C1C0|nr:hypothetical protein [Haliscomenobacter sp.]HOY18383.1 hypothetical protein [Haliscomenobacter sp.]HPH18836.1 hypothetical protein [Haliscomenobacter sp.]